MGDIIIDMDQLPTEEDALLSLARERFAMPPEVVAAFRQAARKGTLRLLKLVESDEKFEKLKPAEQLAVLQMIFDRAYGKAETASSSLRTLNSTGELDAGKGSMTKQLEEINQRAEEKRHKLPEFNKSRGRAKVSALDRLPEQRDPKYREQQRQQHNQHSSRNSDVTPRHTEKGSGGSRDSKVVAIRSGKDLKKAIEGTIEEDECVRCLEHSSLCDCEDLAS